MSTGDRNQFKPQVDPDQYKEYRFNMDPEGLEQTQGRRVRSVKDIILDSSDDDAAAAPDQDGSSSDASSSASSGSSSDEESGEIFNPLAKTPPQYTPMLQEQLGKKAPVDELDDDDNYVRDYDDFLKTFSPGATF